MVTITAIITTISFKTSNSFSDGSTLILLFSSDWDGNPDTIATSTWDSLPAAYIAQDDDFMAIGIRQEM